MNEELIRKLHDQAWGETHEKAIAVTETPIDFQKVLRERFAELIVQECVMLCDKVYEQNDNVKIQAGATFCREDIKQHFGVEE
jgi:hypothetical protein